MKIAFYIVLTILVFLAVSSGITKIMLMQQDVEMFGQYGFNNPILIAFGVTQLVGGILLAWPRHRVTGAVVVAITFLVSAIVLVLAGNIPLAAITVLFVLLLGFIAKKSSSF